MGHLKEHRDELVQRMQITLEDYYRYTGRSEDEIDEEMHEQAINSLSRSYTIAALAENEGIEVEEGELQERLKELAREGENERKLTNKELRSERVKNSVRESLVVQKAVDWLVETAKSKPNESTEETNKIIKEKIWDTQRNIEVEEKWVLRKEELVKETRENKVLPVT